MNALLTLGKTEDDFEWIDRLYSPAGRPTNQCTRIAMRRLLETGWACGGALVSKVVLLARNRYTELSNLVMNNCPKVRIWVE